VCRTSSRTINDGTLVSLALPLRRLLPTTSDVLVVLVLVLVLVLVVLALVLVLVLVMVLVLVLRSDLSVRSA
jgi:hypothetical protein